MPKRKKQEVSEESFEYEELSWDVREAIGNLTYQMKQHHIKPALIYKMMAESPYDVDDRTLRRWWKKLDSEEPLFNDNKASGSKPSLSEFQKRILVGFVIHCNDVPKACGLRELKDFCFNVLKEDISLSTLSRLMKSVGMTSRVLRTDNKGFRYDREALREMIRKWVMERRLDGTWDDLGSLVCSIDFTFTSHRTRRETGFSPGGRYVFPRCQNAFTDTKFSGQPKAGGKASRYTNCILTALWSDGVNRTPAMMFTYNPAFRTDARGGRQKQRWLKHYREHLAHYGVSEERVVYMGALKGEKRTYVPESPELIHIFFGHYALDFPVIIFADGGNSTKNLGDLPFQAHYYYPSAVHAYLSPNDNGLHGPCKQNWRSEFRTFEDDVNCSLFLLHQMDLPEGEIVRGWFNRNFFRDGKGSVEMIDTTVDALMGPEAKRAKYFEACKVMYDTYVKEEPRRGKSHLVAQPEQLGDGLDGEWWNLYLE